MGKLVNYVPLFHQATNHPYIDHMKISFKNLKLIMKSI